LIEQAKAAAQTAEQKQRVALFEMGTWDYMIAGRNRYLEHVEARDQKLRHSSRPSAGEPAPRPKP
jgi:hypothetical protein